MRLVYRAVCLFTLQFSLVLTAPTHGGMARLSWPGWLVTYRDALPARRRSLSHVQQLHRSTATLASRLSQTVKKSGITCIRRYSRVEHLYHSPVTPVTLTCRRRCRREWRWRRCGIWDAHHHDVERSSETSWTSTSTSPWPALVLRHCLSLHWVHLLRRTVDFTHSRGFLWRQRTRP